MSPCPSTQLSQFAGLAPGRDREQKLYFEQKRLYTLQMESTIACRQDCVYCYAGSPEAPADPLLGNDEIRRLLEAASRLEVRAIDWLGGDPLLRRDWAELMEHALSLGLVNNVWTSGLPLADPAIAARVHELTQGGFVSVHLDSIHPETYRALHSRSGPERINTVIAGVDHLLALGKSPDQMINCITYTAFQPPEDAIDTMRWWFDVKGLRTCLTMFNPAGAGAALKHLEPSIRDAEQVFTARDAINYLDSSVSIACMDTDKFYCGTMATITHAGDVTPCSVIREGVGNVKETPLEAILAQHLDVLIHAQLHDPEGMPRPCNACDNNAHCWGCRASAFNYCGDANGLDPKCWIANKS